MASEEAAGAAGRVRSIRGGSLSSFFTLNSSLSALTREGVGVDAEEDAVALPLPFPLLSLLAAETSSEETERVRRFFDGVEGGEGAGVSTAIGVGVGIEGLALSVLRVRACSSAWRF